MNNTTTELERAYDRYRARVYNAGGNCPLSYAAWMAHGQPKWPRFPGHNDEWGDCFGTGA